MQHSLDRIHSSHNPIIKQKISFLLWSIWKGRNTTVFKNEVSNPLACLIRQKKVNVEWRIQTCYWLSHFWGGFFSPFHLHSLCIRWHSPPPGFVKLNFDGSLIHSLAAGEYILRDWTGRLLQPSSAHFVSPSRLSLFLKVTIKSSFGHINRKVKIPSQIQSIIRNILIWKDMGTHIITNHVLRETNMAADWLSRFGHLLLIHSRLIYVSHQCFGQLWQIM